MQRKEQSGVPDPPSGNFPHVLATFREHRARKTWIVILITTLGFLAIGSLFWQPKKALLIYQGKPASFWLRQYCLYSMRSETNTEVQEAVEALRVLSPSSVAYLVDIALYRTNDAWFKKSYLAGYSKLPGWLSSKRILSAEEISNRSTGVLLAMKPSAHLVLPLVTNALNGHAPWGRAQAIFLLGCIGPGAEQAVPYLIPALRDPDPLIRRLAAQSLDFIGKDAQQATTALIKAIWDPPVTENGLRALGKIGPPAAEAIPYLQVALDDPTNNYRFAAAVALAKICPHDDSPIDFIERALTSTNLAQRFAAQRALQELGPQARKTIPQRK